MKRTPRDLQGVLFRGKIKQLWDSGPRNKVESKEVI